MSIQKDCKKFCPYFIPLKNIVKRKYIDSYYLNDYIKCYNYCNYDKKKMINKDTGKNLEYYNRIINYNKPCTME